MGVEVAAPPSAGEMSGSARAPVPGWVRWARRLPGPPRGLGRGARGRGRARAPGERRRGRGGAVHRRRRRARGGRGRGGHGRARRAGRRHRAARCGRDDTIRGRARGCSGRARGRTGGEHRDDDEGRGGAQSGREDTAGRGGARALSHGGTRSTARERACTSHSSRRHCRCSCTGGSWWGSSGSVPPWSVACGGRGGRGRSPLRRVAPRLGVRWRGDGRTGWLGSSGEPREPRGGRGGVRTGVPLAWLPCPTARSSVAKGSTGAAGVATGAADRVGVGAAAATAAPAAEAVCVVAPRVVAAIATAPLIRVAARVTPAARAVRLGMQRPLRNGVRDPGGIDAWARVPEASEPRIGMNLPGGCCRLSRRRGESSPAPPGPGRPARAGRLRSR